MMGMITTLMMHFPVGSFVDAMFFVLKGYSLDGPPRRGVTRSNLVTARTVTLHMLSDILMLMIMGVIWLVAIVRESRQH